MRIMGLDYGDTAIGVAASDALGITAQGIEVIRRRNGDGVKKSVARLAELALEYSIETIVLGYPKNMDGSEGFRCQKTLEFKEKLVRRLGDIPVVLWDERLSTVGADRFLTELSRCRRKEVIDKMAAVFILQGYLDYLKGGTVTGEGV